MCLLMKMHLISLVAAAKRHRAKKWIPNYQISESWACCSLRAKKVRAFFCTFLHGWSGNSVVDCDWLRSRNLLHSICSLLYWQNLTKKPWWTAGAAHLPESWGCKGCKTPLKFEILGFYCIFMWQFLEVGGAIAPLAHLAAPPLITMES